MPSTNSTGMLSRLIRVFLFFGTPFISLGWSGATSYYVAVAVCRILPQTQYG